MNKSDVHDAEGLAQLARTYGAALRQLITARTAMANQLRGLLKLFGLRMGTARTTDRTPDGGGMRQKT